MWMRMKYPWVVSGAIASSVSVQKHKLRDSNIFWQIVTVRSKHFMPGTEMHPVVPSIPPACG